MDDNPMPESLTERVALLLCEMDQGDDHTEIYTNWAREVLATVRKHAPELFLDELVAAKDAEIARLHDRLEDDRVWQMDAANPDGPMMRVDVEPGSVPDGIECRDETIKLLDAEITALRAVNETMAAEWAADLTRLREKRRDAEAERDALRARVAELEGALTTLLSGDYPRPLGERWRSDAEPSDHDRCVHGAMMNESCEACADAFIAAALTPSASPQEPSDDT